MEINCIHAFKKRGQHKKRKIQTNGRGFVKNRVDIDKRPATVNEKVCLGDWEFDAVIGKNHKEALLTVNDRVAGLVWIRLLSGKDASPLIKAAINALEPFRVQIHTITADNGKEFSFHEEIVRNLNIFYLLCKIIPLQGEEPMKTAKDGLGNTSQRVRTLGT